MWMQEFEYHSPESTKEASQLLSSLGPGTRILAGGTDLMADLKQELIEVNHLVSLAKIDKLRRIESTNNGLWIGPLVNPNRLAASKDVQRVVPALSDAGASMAGVQVRNLATIGGNLCSAVPSADLPPSLLTVDAQLELTSVGKERNLSIREFFSGPRETAINEDEILTGIFISALPANTSSAYFKYQLRDASALAVVGAAAALTLNNGKIEKATVAIGASAPTPVIIEDAGEYLLGKEPTNENFAKAGEMAANGVKPITDIRGSEEYRRDLAGVLTVRALKKSLERIQS